MNKEIQIKWFIVWIIGKLYGKVEILKEEDTVLSSRQLFINWKFFFPSNCAWLKFTGPFKMWSKNSLSLKQGNTHSKWRNFTMCFYSFSFISFSFLFIGKIPSDKHKKIQVHHFKGYLHNSLLCQKVIKTGHLWSIFNSCHIALFWEFEDICSYLF